MAAPPDRLALDRMLRQVGQELRSCVAGIIGVETALEPALATLAVPARAQLQQLDLVTQVLAELADLLDRSADGMAQTAVSVPGTLVDAVRLGALRARLAGEQAVPGRSAARQDMHPAGRLELF